MTASRDEQNWQQAQPNLSVGPDIIWKMTTQLPESQSTALKIKFSQTSHHFHTLFKNDLTTAALKNLLQAVIDDDKERVTQILDSRPELLLATNEKLVIESKYTWQKFYAEPALCMAVKRKQLEMVKTLLPYFGTLQRRGDIKDASATVWELWGSPPNYNCITPIPHRIPEYTDYLKSIMNVFKKENFINDRLSEETEDALQYLFNLLLPKEPVKLDDYVEVEPFLEVAIYLIETDRGGFNYKRSRAFAIRVIGLIQSLVSPDMAKMLCEDDVYFLLGMHEKIGKQASMHKLNDGKNFYRPSRDANSGLGFEFLCTDGRAVTAAWGVRSGFWMCARRTRQLAELKMQTQTNPTEIFFKDPRPSRCVIL